MTADGLILQVGATGLLGGEILRLLRESRRNVRAVVRASVGADKRNAVAAQTSDIVTADLKDQASLRLACRGVATVISTATATMSRQDRDTIQSVDEQGQLALVEAAEHAGVKHFVFVSFVPTGFHFALGDAKAKVEERLLHSRMSFTVLQPTRFSEIWLGPALGFDPVQGKARIFGTGERPVSWIAVHDVARFAVAAAAGGSFAGKVIPLGGPDALSPLQVVKIFEELGAPKVALEYVPEAALQAQLVSATDPLAQTFAALTLSLAKGQAIDPRREVELLPGRLVSVREYATRMMAASRLTAT